MRTEEFDYELPRELIAQDPLEDRSASRLLVLDRATRSVSHRRFTDLPEYLAPGDCLVLNTTRVMPARLVGRKQPTGGRVELLLLEACDMTGAEADGVPDRYRAMMRGAAVREGVRVAFDGGLVATVLGAPDEGVVEVVLRARDGDLRGALERAGRLPLPPYITREPDRPDRYQTVYAERAVSAAAPTAGLHFTLPLLERIRRMEVSVARLELAVGMDTFVPVREELVGDHRMHSEWFSLGEECARAVNRTRAGGGRVIAVGTTSVRVLESCALDGGSVLPGEGRTDLFITPGYRFKTVDAVLTNFHFPRSTLLMLVCAFGGRRPVLDAYGQAVAERYRFYSFGDAMLLS